MKPGWLMLIAAASSLLLGGLAWSYLAEPEESAAEVAVAAPPRAVRVGSARADIDASMRIRELSEQLDAARDARLELVERVEQLHAKLAELEAFATRDPGALDAADAGAEKASAKKRGRGREFDEASLIDAGVDPLDANWLHETYDQRELDRLYLRDQAARDPELGRAWVREEHEAQKLALQQELGLENYDLMLYAAGERNRVVVKNVLSRSAAEDSGIRAGDVIRTYAGQPVFAVRDLRRLTSAGTAGQLVTVEILRDGVSRSLGIERGPLGVRLRAERQKPTIP